MEFIDRRVFNVALITLFVLSVAIDKSSIVSSSHFNLIYIQFALTFVVCFKFLYDTLSPIETRHNVATIKQASLLQLSSKEETLEIRNKQLFTNLREHTDEYILDLLKSRQIRPYQLESLLRNDYCRAITLRRSYLSSLSVEMQTSLKDLPFENYDSYSLVSEACCENVLGYVQVPVGCVGPLNCDGSIFYAPLATTEGALVASTNRGCSALMKSGEVTTAVISDSMSRSPAVQFDNVLGCQRFIKWLDKPDNYRLVKQKFDSTSGYTSLKKIEIQAADRLVFLRFCATTGDAMGMNMVSKATEAALRLLQEKHVSMKVISLSGNYCTDKKAAAVNWINGRGKRVIAEATLSPKIVEDVLKTTVDSLVELHNCKNFVGSALAGVLGGFNAHCANIVTAVFIACGQDVAQNVTSSHCLTLLTKMNDGNLRISCTMPCLEVGTIGGGTILPAQRACLEMLGCAGGNPVEPGANSCLFAQRLCALVVAGELSLLAALASQDLVQSHLRLNRSSQNLTSRQNSNNKRCEGLTMPKKSKFSTSSVKRLTPSDGVASSVVHLASSAASSLHPETCSKVLT